MTDASAFPPGLVVYQIYPRSFNDANNDGVGDLAGIIQKLDYLADLGVSALWMCPIYRSPMVDFGYDVSDYIAIDPSFGTMDDFDTLVREAHKRGMLIINDLVFNHTSDQHEWFQRSRQRDPQYEDWYIWADGVGGNPPNNWISCFGGSAWQYDHVRGQYYLHSFAAAQPDLNWHNHDVREALKDVVRFWLNRGVDAFRMDAVMWLAKDIQLRDDPPISKPGGLNMPYDGLAHTYSRGRPAVYSYLKELADIIKPYGNRFMLLEVQFDTWLKVESYHDFYHHIDRRVMAPFNFIDMYLPWEADRFRRFFDDFEEGLRAGDVPIYITGNHDRPRLASRIGEDGARAAAVLFLMLPGVFVLYYGDEIGMEDSLVAQAQDVYEKNLPGQGFGRDPERTPMQWSAERHAGFSDHTPWLAVGENYRTANVRMEAADPGSLLNLYKRLIHMRSTMEVLERGVYKPVRLRDARLVGFARELGTERIVVVVNFSHAESVASPVRGELLISSVTGGGIPDTLAPLEGRVYRVSRPPAD
jgi:alpha-glucosidase